MNTSTTSAPDRWTVKYSDPTELQVTKGLVLTCARLAGCPAGDLIAQAVRLYISTKYGPAFAAVLIQAQEVQQQ